jgi:hypothetical protein
MREDLGLGEGRSQVSEELERKWQTSVHLVCQCLFMQLLFGLDRQLLPERDQVAHHACRRYLIGLAYLQQQSIGSTN